MVMVGVDLLKLRVNSFSVRDESVVLEVHFNDGEQKQIFRTTTLDTPDKVAEDIFSELIHMEENINMRFDGKTMVSDVDVLIKDRKKKKESMVEFFNNLRTMIKKVKSLKVADGYTNLISTINYMELKL